MAEPKTKKSMIREAAYKCFQQSGYHSTSVDAICEQADCSKGSFYWHYKTKQEVFLDILHLWAQEVSSELIKQFETSVVDKSEPFAAISEALHRETRRGRALVPLWLEFTMHARHDEEIRDALAKFYRRARAAIVEVMQPVANPLLTENELLGAATAIFGAFTGLLIQDLTDPIHANAKDAVEQIMSVIKKLLL